MPSVTSTWANSPITIGGALSDADWTDAGRIRIPRGYLLVKNDARFLYLAMDLTEDRGEDPGDGDYYWLTFDKDKNGAITPNVDIQYASWPGHPERLGFQYYKGPNTWTGLHESSDGEASEAFGPTFNSATPHRTRELRIPLSELGINLAAPGVPRLRFGLRISSSNPRFTHNIPSNFTADFTHLWQIMLTRKPSASYPAGTAGAVIGGVGLIPATKISPSGYATTDPGYFVQVKEAVFGGRLHLIGNRSTLASLWGGGARRYRVLYREGNSGPWSASRQTWSNYRWTGGTYVLEAFGPDGAGTYPLLHPGIDYSIDDLLLSWPSTEHAPGSTSSASSSSTPTVCHFRPLTRSSGSWSTTTSRRSRSTTSITTASRSAPVRSSSSTAPAMACASSSPSTISKSTYSNGGSSRAGATAPAP